MRDSLAASGGTPPGLELHLALSLLALILFSLAALQALALALQERQLRRRRPGRLFGLLPPLSHMEKLLFQLVTAAFFILSLSLATGLMFPRELFLAPIAHKTLLAFLAWLTFGGLLLGRRIRGWRGPQVVRWTLGGYAALVLAYFGSKLLLQL